MLEQELLRFLFAVIARFIGGFVGFWFWPWLRRDSIHKGVNVRSQSYDGEGGIWCRVVNGSDYTMGKAVAYITIKHEKSDVLPKPQGVQKSPYLTPQSHDKVDEGQLCWSVQEGGENPMRIDIYAGESQPLLFGNITSEHTELFSENCRTPARVFLKRKKYVGTLKVVCADCPANTFDFELDPDNRVEPIRFIV
jgi:hypothetical protein